MTFAQYLSALPRDHTVITGPFGDRTVGQLLDYGSAIRRKLQGRRLAINLADPVAGIEAIIAADGTADSITLLPTTLPHHHLSTLIERARCDVLLASVHQINSSLTDISVISSLSDLKEHAKQITDHTRGTAWHLATSGTTNVPKLVSHTFSSLSRTVKQRPDLSDRANWGLLYEYMRFAGLQVLLQAVGSGSRLIAITQDQPLRDRIAALVTYGCTHLSATPTLWRAIAMTPNASQLPLKQITLGGEIADARILATLKAVYPDARITHIYASTEAGVGFSVKDGKPGFPASYLDQPPAGLQLRVVDGRLHIRNSEVLPTYVGTNDRFGAANGWIDTEDNVEHVGDRIFFLGRAGGVINVGGNKVHPEEVERLLLAHQAIQEARVYGKPSSIVGAIVNADIVLAQSSQNATKLRAEIRAYLQSRVESYKVPAILNFVDSIESTPTGKISRGTCQ
jgi:acyl-coenzyme A synthetase/AMP-(fatty) acid ligase